MDNEANRSWWTAPRVASATFSAGVLALAIVPGIILGGVFSPELTLLALTLVGLVWYTCFTYEGLELAKRQAREAAVRDRMGLATGLLAELKWTEGRLRQLVEGQGRRPSFDQVAHPVLESSLGRLELFSPTTVGLLTEFVGDLRTIRQVAMVPNMPDGSSNRVSRILEGQARLTIAMGQKLARALVDEGGQMPSQEPSVLLENPATPPALPTSVFGPWDSTRGWQSGGT